MINRSHQLLFSLILSLVYIWLAGAVALAGGWAVITLDDLPAEVVVDQPLTVGFMVRQHGVRPMADLTPQVKATHQETGRSVTVAAEPVGKVGHYVATLTLPESGVWRWSIEAFSMEQPMPLLTVQAAAPAVELAQDSRPWSLWLSWLGLAPAVAPVSPAETDTGQKLTQVERGRDLFIAKGCTTCHYHQAVRETPNIFMGSGPNLTNYPTTAEYLRVWLKDPAAVKPQTAMPDLALKETEIEALVAFLLNPAAPEHRLPPPRPGLESVEEARLELKAAVSERFLVRPQGAHGLLVAYDMNRNRKAFTLPAGLLAADQSRYASALTGQHSTKLKLFEPTTGLLLDQFIIDGRWQLSSLSPTGRWLALTRLVEPEEEQAWRAANRWETDIRIIDTTAGVVTHNLHLAGNFEIETISAAGDALFLIEHLPAINPTQYLIRLYDLAAQTLQADPLRAKTVTDEVMTGLAWGGVASPEGRWLLTLYLNTARDVAFIHALDLANRTPFCIDLPSGEGDVEVLKHYALTLGPDGQTVYAANVMLGVVAEVSLAEFRVTQTVEFPAMPEPEEELAANRHIPTNYAVLSNDGQQLYFSNGKGLWHYDVVAQTVDGPYLRQTPIQGIGLSQDERNLFVAVAGRSPLALSLDKQTAAIP